LELSGTRTLHLLRIAELEISEAITMRYARHKFIVSAQLPDVIFCFPVNFIENRSVNFEFKYIQTENRTGRKTKTLKSA
jgi:hypothetical protein